jgi:hypothetical protein
VSHLKKDCRLPFGVYSDEPNSDETISNGYSQEVETTPASMRRLLIKTTPHIIFLQETLTSDVKAMDFMFVLKSDWMSCVVSSIGNSGSLLVSWDPHFFSFSPSLLVEEFF